MLHFVAEPDSNDSGANWRTAEMRKTGAGRRLTKLDGLVVFKRRVCDGGVRGSVFCCAAVFLHDLGQVASSLSYKFFCLTEKLGTDCLGAVHTR